MLTIELLPLIGFQDLQFGASMQMVKEKLAEPNETLLLNDIETEQAIGYYYQNLGTTLIFEEKSDFTFTSIEIENPNSLLWQVQIFKLKEKELIELFKINGTNQNEIETMDWGEKRISFDAFNIDFYYEKQKLISINYSK